MYKFTQARTCAHTLGSKQPHLHIARHNIHNQHPLLLPGPNAQIPRFGNHLVLIPRKQRNIVMHKTEKRRKTFRARKRKSLLRHMQAPPPVWAYSSGLICIPSGGNVVRFMQ